jgi:fluoroquinolone transport system permease protein
MKKLIKVALNDFRLVFRDNSLKIFIALPLLILLVIRYAVPYIAGIYEFLGNYTGIILMLGTMQGSVAFGFIYSMVLVDEKDTSVAKVYGIMPVSKSWFVVARLIPPFVLATLATFALLLVEPFFGVPVIPNLVYSMLTGLVAPIMILFVAIIARNKIEAMTWQKLFNIPLFLPILAIFIPSSLIFVLAIFPTFWAYKSFDLLIEGGNFWLYILIGFAHTILLLSWMIKRFTKSHFN